MLADKECSIEFLPRKRGRAAPTVERYDNRYRGVRRSANLKSEVFTTQIGGTRVCSAWVQAKNHGTPVQTIFLPRFRSAVTGMRELDR